MNALGKLLLASGIASAILCPAVYGAAPISLPIATDVKVINTPSVQVTSLPGVSVNNPSSSPVPVRDVDQAALQPVSGACAAVYGTTTNLKQCTLYTFPAGKRLVVETVVYQLAVEPASAFPYGVTFVSNAGEAAFTFAPTFVGNDGINHYANAVATRFYLGAGETLSVSVQFSSSTIDGQRFSFSGSLVDE